MALSTSSKLAPLQSQILDLYMIQHRLYVEPTLFVEFTRTNVIGDGALKLLSFVFRGATYLPLQAQMDLVTLRRIWNKSGIAGEDAFAVPVQFCQLA